MTVSRSILVVSLLSVLIGGVMLGSAIGFHSAREGTQPSRALHNELQILKDERAIRDLLNAYGTHLDGRDFRAWVSLFTENGRWIGGLGDFTGREALLDMLQSNLGTAPLEGDRYRTMHLFANPVIRIDRNTATARSRYVFFAPQEDGTPGSVIVGHYEDRLLKNEEGWRFRERRVLDDLFANPD